MENPGIDPSTSRVQSGRSTIWANSPLVGYKPAKDAHILVSTFWANSLYHLS